MPSEMDIIQGALSSRERAAGSRGIRTYKEAPNASTAEVRWAAGDRIAGAVIVEIDGRGELYIPFRIEEGRVRYLHERAPMTIADAEQERQSLRDFMTGAVLALPRTGDAVACIIEPNGWPGCDLMGGRTGPPQAIAVPVSAVRQAAAAWGATDLHSELDAIESMPADTLPLLVFAYGGWRAYSVRLAEA